MERRGLIPPSLPCRGPALVTTVALGPLAGYRRNRRRPRPGDRRPAFAATDLNPSSRSTLAAAASADPHTSAPRRRVEDRPRRDAGAHRRDLVVTTYAMLTRQPWLADVFILSLKAGGIWWNPAVENQATDRAFRIGQHRNVLVHKFVTSGTIEEKIELMLAEKRQLADELIDGDGEVNRTELPDDELLDLVRLDVTRAAR